MLPETITSADSVRLEQLGMENVARPYECRSVTLKCTAHKVTWAHQRKKQRLLDKLSVQKPSSDGLQLIKGMLRKCLVCNATLTFMSAVITVVAVS